MRGIHRSPVNSPHKGQWRDALMFSFNYVCTNVWVNDHDTGDLRRHRVHYHVTVMPAARCRAIKFRTHITPCNGICYLYLRKYDITEMCLGSWPIVTKQPYRPWLGKCSCLLQTHCGHRLSTLKRTQNGRYFADDIFKCNFLNEDISISINISLKFVLSVKSTISTN